MSLATDHATPIGTVPSLSSAGVTAQLWSSGGLDPTIVHVPDGLIPAQSLDKGYASVLRRVSSRRTRGIDPASVVDIATLRHVPLTKEDLYTYYRQGLVSLDRPAYLGIRRGKHYDAVFHPPAESGERGLGKYLSYCSILDPATLTEGERRALRRYKRDVRVTLALVALTSVVLVLAVTALREG